MQINWFSTRSATCSSFQHHLRPDPFLDCSNQRVRGFKSRSPHIRLLRTSLPFLTLWWSVTGRQIIQLPLSDRPVSASAVEFVSCLLFFLLPHLSSLARLSLPRAKLDQPLPAHSYVMSVPFFYSSSDWPAFPTARLTFRTTPTGPSWVWSASIFFVCLSSFTSAHFCSLNFIIIIIIIATTKASRTLVNRAYVGHISWHINCRSDALDGLLICQTQLILPHFNFTINFLWRHFATLFSYIKIVKCSLTGVNMHTQVAVRYYFYTCRFIFMSFFLMLEKRTHPSIVGCIVGIYPNSLSVSLSLKQSKSR